LINIPLEAVTPLVAFLVFTGGLVSGLSPCTLPTVVFVVGYVGGYSHISRRRGFIISLAFILGLSLTLALMGAMAALIGALFLQSKVFWYVISGILIIMGANLLGLVSLPGMGTMLRSPRNKGLIGAFLMGIPFAFVASPCTTPVTTGVLAYAAIKGSPVYGFLLLFLYSVGRSIPLLLAGTFTGLVKNIQAVGNWNEALQKVSGIVLIVLGLWFLWSNT
jgi:cytochrome c biogenesis protein CcdA